MIRAAKSQFNNSVLSIFNPLLHNMQSQLTLISICDLCCQLTVCTHTLSLSLFLSLCAACASHMSICRGRRVALQLYVACKMLHLQIGKHEMWHTHVHQMQSPPAYLSLSLSPCPPVQACLLISQLVNSSVAFAEALRFLQFNSKDSFNECEWRTDCVWVWVSVCVCVWMAVLLLRVALLLLFIKMLPRQCAQIEFLHVKFFSGKYEENSCQIQMSI